jgi:hypothetical protein
MLQKKNCLPKEEIINRLGSVRLTVNFGNKKIDKELYDPFIDFTDGKILKFSSTLKTEYTFEMDALEFLSDEGLLFEKIVKHESSNIEKISMFQSLTIGTEFYPGTFGKLVFYGSGRKNIIQRKYDKIQSILTYLYAIYYISFWLFKLLSQIIFKGNFEEYLIYKALKFDQFLTLKNTNKKIDYKDLFPKKSNHIDISDKELKKEINNHIDNENRNNLNNIEDLNDCADINENKDNNKNEEIGSDNIIEEKSLEDNLNINVKKNEINYISNAGIDNSFKDLDQKKDSIFSKRNKKYSKSNSRNYNKINKSNKFDQHKMNIIEKKEENFNKTNKRFISHNNFFEENNKKENDNYLKKEGQLEK